MVVELAKGGEIGKYTGYYYTASMAAQIVAPILSGVLYRIFGMRNVFFVFATIFVVLSFVTMFFVKHGDSKAEKQGVLEALGGADD
jgi:MFS family permease